MQRVWPELARVVVYLLAVGLDRSCGVAGLNWPGVGVHACVWGRDVVVGALTRVCRAGAGWRRENLSLRNRQPISKTSSLSP